MSNLPFGRIFFADRIRLGLPQRVGLGLPARLRHGFSEIRK